MMTPTELERKVRQLDNDVQAIYSMLTEISATQLRQGNRLEEHSAVLGEHSAILADQSAVLAEHSTALGVHTATLASHGRKLDRILEILEAR